MRTKIILFLLIVLGLFQFNLLWGQPPCHHRRGGKKGPPECDRARIHKKIEKIKLRQLKKILHLSPSEEQELDSLMSIARVRLDSLRSQKRKILEKMKKLREGNNLDNSEKVGELVNKYLKIERSLVKRRIEFMRKRESILTPKQQLQLILFQQRFRKKIRRIIRKFHNGNKEDNTPLIPQQGGMRK